MLREALETAVGIAREAGDLLMQHRARMDELVIDRKGRIDLVTTADRESETLVRDRLASAFSDHDVHGEEFGDSSRGADYRWIVDPLDGTTNFVHGHPMFVVSIGLMHGEDPVVGVVHAPALGETYTAARGVGAFLDGRPMRVSTTSKLDEAMVATGFPYRRAERSDNNLANFGRVALDVRGIRRGGSAALDLAYVACGRFDAFWELHLEPWDVAAGACLIREAGGRVTDALGGDDWLEGGHIVASNSGPLHEIIRGRLEAPESRA